ncbi:MAG: DUF982 domain-containing protein [Rhizobiaceae bacterium]|jgi:hypothetical protein
METNLFEEPVTIFSGLGIPTKVETVAEAFSVLVDWPGWKRDSAHQIALKACRAALAGDIDAETVRSTFVAFARRSAILVPEIDEVVAARATRRFSNDAAA